MYPLLSINLNILSNNVHRMVQLCGEHSIEIVAITKVFKGDPVITKTLVDSGIKRIGDSRVSNLKKNADLPCQKWLIRMPMISEAEEVVKYVDVSLNSEITTIKALEQAAKKLNKKHGICLMYDLGDIREGYLDKEEFKQVASYVKQSPYLDLIGSGTNLTCFSFVHPDTEKLTLLLDVAKEAGAADIISGGNSATIDLMLKGGIPKGVNTLRLGESVLFGKERAHYQFIPETRNDAFILKAEVIEAKEKPSMPWGTFGVDSYGNSPHFVDKGIRKKLICALGKQDTDVEVMYPLDEKIEILGASSDHLMLDVTESNRTYKVGDIIEFRLGYYALLRASLSDDVAKEYIR